MRGGRHTPEGVWMGEGSLARATDIELTGVTGGLKTEVSTIPLVLHS